MCLAIELLKLLALFLRGMSRKWSGGSFFKKSHGVMAHCLDSNFGDHIRAARRSTRLGVNDVQAIGGRHEYEGNLELWSQSLCAFSTKRKCGHMASRKSAGDHPALVPSAVAIERSIRSSSP